jgi:hypothetical protein
LTITSNDEGTKDMLRRSRIDYTIARRLAVAEEAVLLVPSGVFRHQI